MCCPSYYGWIDEKHNNRSYPPLITQELYEKCRVIADENRLEIKRGERLILGSKIVRCKDCGAAYTIESRHMSCCRANRKTCDNTISLRQSVIDYILWQVAFSRHLDYLLDLSASDAEKYSEQIKVIDQKIIYFNKKLKEVMTLNKEQLMCICKVLLINKKETNK